MYSKNTTVIRCKIESVCTAIMTNSDAKPQYVVLADIIESRHIDDRELFETRLANAFEYVNKSEYSHISTPFTQMKGVDEFGCVLTDIHPVVDIISGILDRIYPTYARFGIASGEIDIGANRQTVAEMDGPAFHRASALLEQAEENGLFVGVQTDRQADRLVASALNLLLLERESLTERQMEVILAYEACGTQSKAGANLGLGQQAVSNLLRRANYTRRKQIRKTIRETVQEIYD